MLRVALQEMGWELNVVATGGHLNPPDDLLVPAEGEMVWLAGEQMVSRSTHGTGCAFSSALLSRLVLGDGDGDAALAAKRYVAEAIRKGGADGQGDRAGESSVAAAEGVTRAKNECAESGIVVAKVM